MRGDAPYLDQPPYDEIGHPSEPSCEEHDWQTGECPYCKLDADDLLLGGDA